MQHVSMNAIRAIQKQQAISHESTSQEIWFEFQRSNRQSLIIITVYRQNVKHDIMIWIGNFCDDKKESVAVMLIALTMEMKTTTLQVENSDSEWIITIDNQQSAPLAIWFILFIQIQRL